MSALFLELARTLLFLSSSLVSYSDWLYHPGFLCYLGREAKGWYYQSDSVAPQERIKFIQFPPTASTKLRDTRSQWNIHAISKAYTVVWVLIQSLMSFTAPEDRFLESLPGNGLSYQSWSDLALGFVRYHICISNLQQQLRSNTRDITRRISVLLFSLHLLHLLYLLHPQHPLHLLHLLHLLELLHLLLLLISASPSHHQEL